ncbi:MAG: hypothetical protein OXJ52_08850 [Oligoflexia bacterium]|nr:hypothetical protein [Oligoflexia bacterium]
MKSAVFLFFVIFLFNSCQPLSLDDEEGRGRDFKIDPAKGKENFKLPNLKGISGKEIVKKAIKEDCTKYRNSANFSILGDISPSKPLQNCLAKAIDEGLKPLCEDEEKAKELKRYYEKEGDEQAVREVEEYLFELEEIKYQTTEDIYFMADEFYDQCEEWNDEIEDYIDGGQANSIAERLMSRGGKLLVSSECHGFRRVLDSKARTACRNLDFSKIRRK